MSPALASNPSTQVSIICCLQWPQIGMRKKTPAKNNTVCVHVCVCVRAHAYMGVDVCVEKTFVGFEL